MDESVHEAFRENKLFPLLHFSIPFSIIEELSEEMSNESGWVLNARMLKQLEVRLMPWYNGGLNSNLEYEFTVVLVGFGKEFELKPIKWYGDGYILRKIGDDESG